MPCHIPLIPHGRFKLSKSDEIANAENTLSKEINVSNGEVVEFSCNTGYNIQGPSNLRCWHGEWTGTSLPECIPGKVKNFAACGYNFANDLNIHTPILTLR